MNIELKKILFTFNDQLVSISNLEGSPNVRLYALKNLNSNLLRLSVNVNTNEWHILYSNNGSIWERVPENPLLAVSKGGTVFYKIFPQRKPFWNPKQSNTSCMSWMQSLVNTVEKLVKESIEQDQINYLNSFSSEVSH
tara:strand:- start:36544 stop:36957 length:414 start_codon:yes stop_codon:yes gene_type:complete